MTTTTTPKNAAQINAGPFAVLRVTKDPGKLTTFETGIKVPGKYDLMMRCTRYGEKTRTDVEKTFTWLQSLVTKYPSSFKGTPR